mmetsp:Transcript_13117/g.27062  ORF Transcript_13117/g.27062 Transcript_13117/m.27062 type:complete len:136 (-) Transcript_13117:196-603(-)
MDIVLVSPTPIRPVSPATPRDTPSSDSVSDLYIGMEVCGDSDGEMELGLEIFEIFQGSLGNRSAEYAMLPSTDLRPPSRNSNPLLKDQRFSCSASPVDRDTFASTLCSAMCEDLRHNFAYNCSLEHAREVVVGSS